MLNLWWRELENRRKVELKYINNSEILKIKSKTYQISQEVIYGARQRETLRFRFAVYADLAAEPAKLH